MSGIGNLPSDYKQTEMDAFRKSGANFNEYFNTKGSGYEPVKSKSSADSFLSRFKSNMADYFDEEHFYNYRKKVLDIGNSVLRDYNSELDTLHVEFRFKQ